MYKKWGLPTNICDNHPINEKNLDLFVGHDKIINILDQLLERNSVIILEGEIGVGKTSMGNYVRFKKKNSFTASSEIRCNANWDTENFIHVVLATIIEDIYLPDSKISGLRNVPLIQELKTRYSDEGQSGYGVSIGSAAIGSIGMNKSKSLSRTNMINQAILEKNLKELGDFILKNLDSKGSVIIQLNNIDINHGFSDEKLLINFLNNIRDTLQTPNFSWILNGAEGLSSIIKNKIKRFDQIVNRRITIPPLSIEEIKMAFKKRIVSANEKGNLPIDSALFEIIYKIHKGAFRGILSTIQEILDGFVTTPLKTNISIADVSELFQNNYHLEIEKIRESKPSNSIFMAIANQEGITQKEIVKLTNIVQSNVSQKLNELEDSGFIYSDKKAQTKHYYLCPEYFLAMYNNKKLDSMS